MKKKLVGCLLVGCMFFSLMGCEADNIDMDQDSIVQESEAVQQSTTETETKESETNEEQGAAGTDGNVGTVDYELDYSDVSGEAFSSENAWMNVVYEKVLEIRTLNESLEPEDDSFCTGYFLHDMNGDQIPELFFDYHTFEAGAHVTAYEVMGDEMVYLGEFGSVHSVFYAIDGALIQHEGHMGDAAMYEITQDGDGFVMDCVYEENIDELGVERYTPVTSKYPEAKVLNEYRVSLDLGLLLYEDRNLGTKVDLSDAEVQQIFEDTMQNNGQIYGVSGDGYGGDCGVISFDDYLKKGVIYEYMEDDGKVESCAYHDINGDGQSECILFVEDSSYSGNLVILSLQDHKIYAYSIHFVSGYDYAGDGVFTNEAYECPYTIVFYGDECAVNYLED